ncbi:hypothetical protein K9N68_31405 [Kovacikia minuta CCNUW1]|uniref:hypothetical protein n=1 Tax=Kovacikia minuta TaxID=2931930 RepID=UPI001CCCCA53|nr:hypothetical protein [Kovacikia minuta]UBF25993.1 hypothetical protein K9N68_31405 [Kovacikia minuta CCNUW1]
MIFGLIVISVVAMMLVTDALPKPGKTPEEEVGEAISKYLKNVKEGKEKGKDK